MDCTPFTIDFTGSPEELSRKMQLAASEQNITLNIEADTISGKVFGMTVVKANYKINGQQITVTITQNPPGYPCEKTQHIITKFIAAN